MAKRPERTRKASQANYNNDSATVSFLPTTRFVSKRKKAEPLEPQTDAQEQYLFAMQNSQLIFALGPAGTGKTYVASAYAADLLQSKDIEQIIITRPNVEVGAGFGFLPGELEEKYAPYLAPFREVMIERMGLSQYEYALKAETISPRPLAFMRGATFNDAFVILDEAQNCTPAEMKMFLTRIGKNCTVVVDGDPDQCDLHGPSGLDDAVNRLERIPGVSVVEFTEDDIVRSGLIKDILCAYRN
jgi:phosphate starvation-inducible protein PhoH and related proteins